MTFLIWYFIGMVLTWIIGILFMKYNDDFVPNRCDLGDAVELMLAISILSWVVVISVIIVYLVYCIKHFICNVFGDWILKNKEDF